MSKNCMKHSMKNSTFEASTVVGEEFIGCTKLRSRQYRKLAALALERSTPVLSQLAELKRALAASQQQTQIARQQFGSLTQINARLRQKLQRASRTVAL